MGLTKQDEKIVKKLGIWTRSPQLKKWKDLIHKIKNPKDLKTYENSFF